MRYDEMFMTNIQHEREREISRTGYDNVSNDADKVLLYYIGLEEGLIGLDSDVIRDRAAND